MLKEFRVFVMRGNVLDMAIGIILGVAFSAIVNSVVKDILMPPIGLLLGKTDFNNLYINLSGSSTYTSLEEARKAGAAVIAYGVFVNTLINFLIIAFVLFLMVRKINMMKRKQEVTPTAPTTKDCPFCYSTISIKATRCPNCTSEIKT